MIKSLNKLYEKVGQLMFALIWIGVYCLVNSFANVLSKSVGVDSIVTAPVNVFLSLVLLQWIRANGFLEKYGLCAPKVSAKCFFWYIPFLVMVSRNLWQGVAVNLPLVDTVFYIVSMLCVGFLEEVIFRGLLFKAMAEENGKMAIIVSSVTFGIGHLLNLINGSGMELVANLCQVVCATAIGFLFVITFHRGGSLIPCIVAHSIHNSISIFADETGITEGDQVIMAAILAALMVAGTFVLLKTLPKPEE